MRNVDAAVERASRFFGKKPWWLENMVRAILEEGEEWEYARALPDGNVFLPADVDDNDLGFPVRRRKAGPWEVYE